MKASCVRCGNAAEVDRIRADDYVCWQCVRANLAAHHALVAGAQFGSRKTRAEWPMLSDSVGVLPKQIGEAQQHAEKHGVPTEFTPDGQVVFRNRAHRKAYCKAIGFKDLDGGYGDP